MSDELKQIYRLGHSTPPAPCLDLRLPPDPSEQDCCDFVAKLTDQVRLGLLTEPVVFRTGVDLSIRLLYLISTVSNATASRVCKRSTDEVVRCAYRMVRARTIATIRLWGSEFAKDALSTACKVHDEPLQSLDAMAYVVNILEAVNLDRIDPPTRAFLSSIVLGLADARAVCHTIDGTESRCSIHLPLMAGGSFFAEDREFTFIDLLTMFGCDPKEMRERLDALGINPDSPGIKGRVLNDALREASLRKFCTATRDHRKEG
jgi:hypothetical protein